MNQRTVKSITTGIYSIELNEIAEDKYVVGYVTTSLPATIVPTTDLMHALALFDTILVSLQGQ